ncbi:MAG: LptF/LptG family permease [Armatimonadota bacterium]
MRRLDRYITSSFLPLLLFGVGAFTVILVGVELLPRALKMVVREDLPLGLVARVFAYNLPAVIVLTIPMSVMFASLMTVSGLSSHGELLALRAGGIPFLRVAVPVIFMGFILSGVTLAFNEAFSPWGTQRAQQLLREYRESGRDAEYLTFQIPRDGPPKRMFYMRRYSPSLQRADRVLVIEFEKGEFARLYQAEHARWQGEYWILENPTHKEMKDGTLEELKVGTIRIYTGRTPKQVGEIDRDPDDMSIAQLQKLLHQRRMMDLEYHPHIVEIHQLIHMRLALPWCALGFAMLGAALGVRPMRATAGVGFGVSLLVVFAYYVVFHALTLTGERGLLSPFLTAWLPNVLLFATGIYLMYRARG